MGTTTYWPSGTQAQPTVGDVFNTCRSQLVGNATDVSVFSDTILQPYFEIAYRELWQTMESVSTPRVKRTFYASLPAYTTILNPFAINVNDMEEPEVMGERPLSGSVAIAFTLPTTPIQVQTLTAHGLGTNSGVTIGEVDGTFAPCGRWFVTVIDATTLSLNGSTTDGNTGTGGTVYTAQGYFSPVASLTYETDRPLSSQILDYQWQDNVFQFRGATAPNEIRVDYWASGVAPNVASATLSIPGSTAFLATRTAALAADGKGWYDRSDRLNRTALGASMDASGQIGGLLRSFLEGQVRGLQRNQYRNQAFTPASDSYNDQYPYGFFPTSGS